MTVALIASLEINQPLLRMAILLKKIVLSRTFKEGDQVLVKFNHL